MKTKRVTLFAGHYGSGKTNIAVSYALRLARDGRAVTLADLDIVNPYFRAKDSAEALAAAGVRLLSSPYANSNVDLPAIPQEMYAVVDDRSRHAVLDIGGDDRGALALGRFAPGLLREGDYEMLLVVNCRRPLSQDAGSTLDILREIETAGGVRFSAIVNNSNLGPETTAQTVLDSLPYAEEISRQSGLPVKMTCADARLFPELEGKIPNLMPLSLQKRDFL
ncbi:MAG: hypothetical protein HFF17_11100 [Oscillospiraceae bacterium]|nr:hypothetical protein [Oscillospiraceae bacterium]